MKIKFKKLSGTAVAPFQGSKFAAGFDLTVDELEFSNDQIKYNSNIAVEIPEGYVGLLFPRSSVYKHHILLTNSVGVIDSDYRGPIKAVFQREEAIRYKISGYRVGERFAQLIIVKNPSVKYIESDTLSETERGDKGYGSTGK